MTEGKMASPGLEAVFFRMPVAENQKQGVALMPITVFPETHFLVGYWPDPAAGSFLSSHSSHLTKLCSEVGRFGSGGAIHTTLSPMQIGEGANKVNSHLIIRVM